MSNNINDIFSAPDDTKWHVLQYAPQDSTLIGDDFCDEVDTSNTLLRRAAISTLYCTDRLRDQFERSAKYPIEDIGYTKSPEYSTFNSGDSITINDASTIVDGLQFINWDAIDCYDRFGYFATSGMPMPDDIKIATGGNSWLSYAVTSGKRCMLLKTNIPDINLDTPEQNPFSITIANIVNTHANPYGGDTEQAKLNSVFYSFGDY